MASAPSARTDIAEKLDRPQSSDGSKSIQNVQDRDNRANEIADESAGHTSRRKLWKRYSDGPYNWWFASTAIPLVAASLGPLANVLSICALVTSWRETVYIDGQFVGDFDGVLFPDPPWCYWLNVASLITGFLGNVFLLLNFTQRIRYIFALPLTIVFWYLSTGFLIGITACMEIYAPPARPNETYTQGFWYAVIAAVLYLICSMILMVNMLGYFLGHYPDHFALTDAQRTLILQTMLFFIWLAGGGAIFSRIESDAGETGWAFPDALYFCDVTILTVGFGDLYPTTDVGRGLVFPYSVGGIIMLGLVISAIYKFMRQIGEENIVQKHIRKRREYAVANTVTSSFDLRQREHAAHHLIRRRGQDPNVRPNISAPTDPRAYRTAMGNTVKRTHSIRKTLSLPKSLSLPAPLKRKPRIYLLKEEKDRFDTMRRLQRSTDKFKRWYALTFSVCAFSILWCVGAVVFWQCEKDAQGMTYFQALYFCYVSLLTIGYGDLAPKSNPGRCFFVVWSLIAVPTMTILISDMGDTVIEKFKTWSNQLADFTILPKEGIWRMFLDKHPWLLNWLQSWHDRRAAKKRLKRGFATMNPEEGQAEDEGSNDVGDEVEEAEELRHAPALTTLATEAERDLSGQAPTPAALSRRLALCIRRVAADLRLPKPRKYDYEDWVEFTRLIKFSKMLPGSSDGTTTQDEDEDELIDWDWLGENSPLMSGLGESEWLLERLTESLVRLERRREASGKLGDIVERKEAEGSRNCVTVDGTVADSGPTVRAEPEKSSSGQHSKQNQVLASGANGARPE